MRIDSGVYEGGEISMFYDPMIAKVTTWGRDRDNAIALMRRALDEFYIKGVHHNIAFLTALMANPRFLQGRLSTAFIAEEYPDGFAPAPLDEGDLDSIIAAGMLMHLRYMHRAKNVGGQMPGYGRKIEREQVAVIGKKHYPVSVEEHAGRGSEEGFDIVRDGHTLSIRSDWIISDPVLAARSTGCRTVQGRTRRHRLPPLSPGRRGRRDGVHATGRRSRQDDAGAQAAGHVEVPPLADAGAAAIAGGRGRRKVDSATNWRSCRR